MSTYKWVASTGDFNTAANWDQGAVPGETDAAVVNQGMANDAQRLFVISSGGSAGSLQVAGSGTVVNLSSGFYDNSGSATVGITVASGGTLDASGATYNDIGLSSGAADGQMAVTGSGTVFNDTTSGTLVGYGGFGVLTVTNGAAANIGTLLDIGDSGGTGELSLYASGSLSVTGALQVGRNGFGNATLGIFGGGSLITTPSALSGGASTAYFHIGEGATGTGFVTVSGSGAEVDFAGAPIRVGVAGRGTLTVENGGQVFAGTQDSTVSAALGVGQSSGGVGAITVSSPGSLLSASGFVYVGRAGQGSLVVTASGTAILGAAAESTEIGGGTSSGATGGSGTLSVVSGGVLSAVDNLLVGVGGDSGSVYVGSGGTIVAGGQIGIGDGTSGIGSGTATFTVAAGGIVSAAATPSMISSGRSGIFLANSAGDQGTLLVSGAGARVDAGGLRLTIGDFGDATVTVAAGGSIVTGSTSATYPAIAIGLSSGGSGVLSVSDSGSVVTAGGQIVVGSAGSGTLLVQQGATVVASGASSSASTGLVVAATSTGSGSVTVSGSGAVLSVPGPTEIGLAASGSLTVLAGGAVQTTDLDIGGSSTGSGLVTVGGDAASDRLGVTDALTLGVNGSGTLALGSGGVVTVTNGATVGAAGTVTGTGTFGAATVSVGGSYAAGGLLSAGTVTVTGSIAETGQTLTVSGTVSGSGQLDIGSGGDIRLAGAVSGASPVFTAGSGTLEILAPGSFSPVISGYVGSDLVEVRGLGTNTTPTYSSVDGGLETLLTFQNGVSLTFAGNYASGSIHVVEDGTACYCTGTLILTDKGEVAVEALAAGDVVVTAGGAHRAIRWIGTRCYSGRFIAGRRDVLPVRLRAGCLADGVPRRDLLVSPLHAMMLDGVLVPAHALVNGASITQADQVDAVHYVHVELDSHDVLLAEGAASESFVDDHSRGMFQNAATHAALYPGHVPVPATYCAPRVDSGEALEAIQRAINLRAGVAVPGQGAGLRGALDGWKGTSLRGWAQNPDAPEAPVCLEILVDGVSVARTIANRFRPDLLAAGLGSGRHGFHVALSSGLLARAITVRRVLDGTRLGSCGPQPVAHGPGAEQAA